MRHIAVTTTNCCCFRSVCSPCAHNLLHKRPERLLKVTTAPRKHYTYAKAVHNSAGRAKRARTSGTGTPEQPLVRESAYGENR